MSSLLWYNRTMDKLAYHYNKKKLPAKTEGKYLYYYPSEDMESATAYMGGRGFVTIEVTEKEWEALIELDRIEYNNEHKYIRHTTELFDEEDETLTAKQLENFHVKDTPIDTRWQTITTKKTYTTNLLKMKKKFLKCLRTALLKKI